MRTILFIRIILLVSPTLTLAQAWTTLPIYENDSLRITLRVRDTIFLDSPPWIFLDLENKAPYQIGLENFKLNVVLLRDSLRERWSPDWEINFRDIDLFSEWDKTHSGFFKYILFPNQTKSTWKRLEADIGGELLSPYQIYKPSVLDIPGRKVKITVECYEKSLGHYFKSDTIEVFKAEITEGALNLLALRLDEALKSDPGFLEYGVWFRALLVPELVNRIGLFEVIQYVVKREQNAFHGSVVATFLFHHGLKAKQVDSLAESAFQEGFTNERVKLLSTHDWWRPGYEEEFIKILESERFDQQKSEELLLNHAERWNSNVEVRSQIAKYFLKYFPLENLPTDSFNSKNFVWAWNINKLKKTRDTILLVPYFKFHLSNKALNNIYEIFDFDRIPPYLPPTRVCDYALHAIYDLRRMDIKKALLRVSGKTEAQTHWTMESFNDKTSFLNMDNMDKLRDKLIEELKRE